MGDWISYTDCCHDTVVAIFSQQEIESPMFSCKGLASKTHKFHTCTVQTYSLICQIFQSTHMHNERYKRLACHGTAITYFVSAQHTGLYFLTNNPTQVILVPQLQYEGLLKQSLV